MPRCCRPTAIPAARVHARVRALLEHHERALRRDPAAAYAVSAARATGLRPSPRAAVDPACPQRSPRLDAFNQMIAVCETLAHLDVLTDRAVLVTDDGGRPPAGVRPAA